MSGTNETRFRVQHDWSECKCGLNESLCNLKQKWNHDEYRCECKELDEWSSCKKDCIWNPSTCDCGYNKAYKTDEYLDTKNYSWEKRLVSKLVLKFENEMLNKLKPLLMIKK